MTPLQQSRTFPPQGGAGCSRTPAAVLQCTTAASSRCGRRWATLRPRGLRRPVPVGASHYFAAMRIRLASSDVATSAASGFRVGLVLRDRHRRRGLETGLLEVVRGQGRTVDFHHGARYGVAGASSPELQPKKVEGVQRFCGRADLTGREVEPLVQLFGAVHLTQIQVCERDCYGRYRIFLARRAARRTHGAERGTRNQAEISLGARSQRRRHSSQQMI